MNYLEMFDKLILKNKEINKLSLKKDNYKNEYIHSILKEVINENYKIKDFLCNILKDLEMLNTYKREYIIHNFIKTKNIIKNGEKFAKRKNAKSNNCNSTISIIS